LSVFLPGNGLLAPRDMPPPNSVSQHARARARAKDLAKSFWPSPLHPITACLSPALPDATTAYPCIRARVLGYREI